MFDDIIKTHKNKEKIEIITKEEYETYLFREDIIDIRGGIYRTKYFTPRIMNGKMMAVLLIVDKIENKKKWDCEMDTYTIKTKMVEIL